MDVHVQFYDFIARHTDELPLLTKLAGGFGEGAQLFEGGAGNGRLAIPLAHKGFNVHSVDINPEMINEFQKRLHPEPEQVQTRIKLEQADFTEIELPDDSYDFVYFSSNTFIIIKDENKQQMMLEKIYKALKKSGMLYIETFNPSGFFEQIFSQRGLQHLYTKVNPATNLETAHFVSYLHNPLEQILIAYNFLEEFPSDQPSRRYSFREIVRYMNFPELRYRLKNAGFSSVEAYGDYEMNPLEILNLKMITLAKK